MTTIDTDHFRTMLLEERERVQKAIANLRDDHPGSLDDEVEEIAATSDNHLGETASATLGREIDYTLGENSEQVLSEIEAALERIEQGKYGVCVPSRAARGAPVGVPLHRRRTPGRAKMTQPARQRDVRVGSSTDGLAPVSFAERSLAAGLSHWLALAAIGFAAIAADQLTKYIVTSQLQLDDGLHVVGPFWIHHVQNSGIAFGLFASATAVVILLTTIAVSAMLIFFARSGARHPILPVALGLVIGGSLSNLLDRVRLGYVTDFLDLRYWPAFNLADSFIVIGVLVLLAAVVFAEREPRRPRPVRDATARP